MEFRILGPLEFADEGALVPLGGARQRALLAILLLSANEVVSADRLIDELWGERAPGSGRTALQVRISQLRKALGRGGALVVTRPPGYVVRLDRQQFDLYRFERLVAEADGAEPAIAAAKLREGLELWRGPPLVDLSYESFAQAAIGRLEELRLAALEKRIEADLALGRHAEQVAELEALVAEHPMRERLRGQLMLALYRSGRQADALERYRQTRITLVGELGLEPARELAQLERRILAQDPTLEAPRRSRVEPTGPLRSARGPLPGRVQPYGPPVFVDRRFEREALARAVAEAAASGRRAAFVTGEPGIGKTRLVSEIAHEAHAAGTLVLAGRCDDGLNIPYQPFVEALEQLVENAPLELLQAHVREWGDTVARLVPALAVRVTERAPPASHASETERYVLFAAVESLLSAGASAGPLLLVLEDLQWADRPTVQLLRRLLTSPRSAPMIVIATCRLGQLARSHPVRELLADLHREPDVSRLDLEGLAAAEVGELTQAIANLSPERAEPALAETLKSNTGGNPFFVIELVRSLAETGTLVQSDGRWRVARDLDLRSGLPDSITETLGRRVALLGPETGSCLGTAAVAGYEFDLELISAVADTESVAEHLHTAVTGGLLVELDATGARFRFAHALIRDWLYGESVPSRRVEIHRRIALRLERRLAAGHVSVVELASHWTAGSRAPNTEEALRYSALAGDEALARLAPDDARRWYGVALELHAGQRDPSHGVRCDLLIRRGEAERQAGNRNFRETLLEACQLAQTIDDGTALVRAVLANTRGLQSASGMVDQERVDALTAALHSVGAEDSVERAQLLATQAVELAFSGEWERRSALSDEALAIARRLVDVGALSTVLNLRFLTLWAPETHAERLANTVDAVSAAERIGDPLSEFYAYHWRVAVSIEGADIVEARRFAAREREVADRLRQPTTLWLAACDDANLAMIDARLEEAERLATTALQTGQDSEPDALACYTAQISYIYFEQGRLGGLIPLLEQVVEQNPGIPGFRSTLALALCDEQRHDDARRLIEIDAESGFLGLAYDVTWLSVGCIFAHVSAQLAHADACSSLYELLEPWQGLVAYPGFGVWGPVAHYLGALATALGHLDAAERHLAEATRCNERMGAPVWTARTGVQKARLLRALGHEQEGRAQLVDALASAEAHGCPTIAAEARGLLTAEDGAR